jgi:hypothetical protein
MNRTDTLRNAEALINGDRARDYGDAAENFQRIADLCTPVLAAKLQPGARLDAHEVALILTQLKVARLITSPAHEDSWQDAAGYIALGAEIATTPATTPEPATRPAEPPQKPAESGLRVGARVRIKKGAQMGAFITSKVGKKGTIASASSDESTDWIVSLDGHPCSYGFYTDELEVIA